MSLPSSERWFSLTIRRNRKSYIFANLILIAIMIAVIAVLYAFESSTRAREAIFFIFFAPYIVAQYFLTAQRLRDFGVTGWLALLWIAIAALPEEFSAAASAAFLLVLCTVPGTAGANRYGPDPLQE